MLCSKPNSLCCDPALEGLAKAPNSILFHWLQAPLELLGHMALPTSLGLLLGILLFWAPIKINSFFGLLGKWAGITHPSKE